MKGVGFWFSLSLTGGEEEKKNNKKNPDLMLFLKACYFIHLPQMQQVNCGWVVFPVHHQVFTQYLIYFHHILMLPAAYLSLSQKPSQLIVQLGGNTP